MSPMKLTGPDVSRFTNKATSGWAILCEFLAGVASEKSPFNGEKKIKMESSFPFLQRIYMLLAHKEQKERFKKYEQKEGLYK
jgi:hypothetical protein